MHKLTGLVILLIALAACGQAPAAPATAVPAAAAPTAVPLDQVDLEPLLIQAGDLPAGLQGAQVLDTQPKAYESLNMPAAEKLVFQRLQRGGNPAGYVVVSLYADAAQMDDAAAKLSKDIGAGGTVGDAGDIGESATLATDPMFGAHLAFRRCAALANVVLSKASAEEVIAYARRLDKRLSAAVCR